ncbi:hypothetical protein SAMN02799624_05391 [Paenibacillus sp. UNC496MF]|uniref:hypothetical protein n=1 Tax=Paenibacillus sp. UNC496MF TaxID=1502753 RepID=UPI0008E7A84E|nr:hypothetical protein [Paenibacillus sp. UNC496MF]SFJ65303.1 hypothetical protein SAMN02799624_05391 [Paenibacillus sp. UNC496MF]
MSYAYSIQHLKRALGSLLILKKTRTRTKINLNARIRELEEAIKLLEKEQA